MSRSFVLAGAVLVCCALRAAAGAEISHFEQLELLTRSTAVAGKPFADRATPFTLAFNALGKDFTLELEPNARLSEVEKTLHVRPGVAAYRGAIAGKPGSWARIVMDSGTPMGMFWDGQMLYAIEAQFDSAAATTAPIIFRLDDVYITPGTLLCGSAEIATAAQAFAAIVSDTAQLQVLAQQGAALNLDLGAAADFEFSQSFGANAETALLARFNNVDGIFSSQLGVQVSVPPDAVEIFTASDDPFTSTDPSTLLDEVAVYRGNTPIQDAQGLTHLFTGRDLDGTTAGIAYVGTVCAARSRFDALGRSFGVGLSEGSHGLTIDSLIAAHEMGHNFGAPHDAEAGSACETTPATFLMAPNINGNSTFSDCSVSQMQPVIDGASCLTPIGPPDLALSAVAPNATHAAGAPFDYLLDVRNLGIDPATSVGVTITLAPELVIDAAEVTNGTCTTATQQVSCDLGDLTGGATRSVTLTLHATAVGDFTVSAVATSDQDANPNNNASNDTVTAEPGVDLGLAGTASALALNASGSVSIAVTNNADFAATDVLVEVGVGAGLRIDAATLASASCSLMAGTAKCALPTLGARQSATLLLTLAATAVGQQQLGTSVSGTETEINATDNTLALTINIAAPSASAGSSGGGSSGIELVALLLALIAKGGPLRGRVNGHRIRR